MLFQNLSFRAMESSLDALSMKQNVIAHNLANLETPGFKAKKVTFQNVLNQSRSALDEGRYRFQATISEDDITTVRPDGNNVDFDKENVELMNVYFQTLALYQKVSGQISDTRYVIKQAFK